MLCRFIVQAEFVRGAQRTPALKSAFRRQAASLTAGLACFGLEDAAMEHGVGWTHALWHSLAGYAVSSVNALIQHQEALSAR